MIVKFILFQTVLVSERTFERKKNRGRKVVRNEKRKYSSNGQKKKKLEKGRKKEESREGTKKERKVVRDEKRKNRKDDVN